ncbi:hypothetical protein AB3S75_000764 [Citrus x aurantiifolia]
MFNVNTDPGSNGRVLGHLINHLSDHVSSMWSHVLCDLVHLAETLKSHKILTWNTLRNQYLEYLEKSILFSVFERSFLGEY